MATKGNSWWKRLFGKGASQSQRHPAEPPGPEQRLIELARVLEGVSPCADGRSDPRKWSSTKASLAKAAVVFRDAAESLRSGKDPNGQPVDHQSVGRGLLMLKADLERIGLQFLVAAECSDPEAVNAAFVECERIANALEETEKKDLLTAVSSNEVTEVRQLINQGADLDERNYETHTPLMIAALLGNREIVEMLLAAGADVDARRDDRRTALLLLCSETSIGGLDGLSISYDQEGTRTSIASLLLQNGADVNATDSVGNTPIILAAAGNHTALVQLLLDNGANVNAKDKHNKAALGVAAYYGYCDPMELLIAHNCDVNAQDEWGWSALMRAADRGHLEAVKLLLAHNADVNAKSNEGNTALAWATDSGHDDVVALLKSHNPS